MALINCPECGKEISDKAPACIHCGYPLDKINANPIPQENKEGTVIIYGIKQKFLIGGTMKIYLDGVYYGDVKKNQSIEFKIYKDTEITDMETLMKIQPMQRYLIIKSEIKEAKSEVEETVENIE